jgi:hypothetical protein
MYEPFAEDKWKRQRVQVEQAKAHSPMVETQAAPRFIWDSKKILG